MTNVKEASLWLSYTYLFVRMLKNPLAYGVPWHELSADPRLEGRRKVLISDAARQLERHVATPRSHAALFVAEFVTETGYSSLMCESLQHQYTQRQCGVYAGTEVEWIFRPATLS